MKAGSYHQTGDNPWLSVKGATVVYTKSLTDSVDILQMSHTVEMIL